VGGPGEIFTIETVESEQALDITAQVEGIVSRAGLDGGFCQVMVLHSTAAVIVNENDDPNIGFDVIQALDRIVPTRNDWLHDRIDDNAHSHIKASLLGPSELVAIRDGRLLLGKWQGIILLEFDGPRRRRVSVQFLPGAGGGPVSD
jgi:secondary thiamine-phosphate synthase enzyme